MAKRVVRDVVRNVVHEQASREPAVRGVNIERGRAPSYLVCRRGVYFFQIRLPDGLVPCRVRASPVRVRLGRLARRQAQRQAARLGFMAQAAFERWRRHMDVQDEETRGEIGFEPGASHEEFLANMLAHLREAAVRLQNPAPDHTTPAILRGSVLIRTVLHLYRIAKPER